jgi:hypothetical protein
MTIASGFTWVAREPRLMVGAMVRTSSQRSTDYHKLTRITQRKILETARSCQLLGGRIRLQVKRF